MSKLVCLMPTYNKEETLSKAIASVMMQKTGFEYKLIILDDCSTDNSNNIAQEFKQKYKRKEGIIGVFQVMEQPLTMTGGGPNGATESLALLAYKYAFEYFKFDKGMATGVITFIILIFMTIFYTKLEKKVNE